MSQPSLCNQPTYTSYDYSGVNLDLLGLSKVATNINRSIDGNANSYSTLSLGVLGVAATIKQRAHFESPSVIGEQLGVRFSIGTSLLSLNILNSVRIKALKGANEIFNQSMQEIISTASLDSLNRGLPTTIYFTPNASCDKVVFEFSSLVGVSVAQEIRIYEFIKRPSSPFIDVTSSNTSICEGTSALLVANSSMPNATIYYYNSPTSTTRIATAVAGSPTTIGTFSTNTTIYASSGYPNCPMESFRIPILINVTPGPESTDLSIPNLQPIYCAVDTINIRPHSTAGNTTRWHLTNSFNNIIDRDTLISGIRYFVNSADNSLNIFGANTSNSPLTVFLSTQDPTTGCWSAPGDLLPVIINIQDVDPPTLNATIPSYCLIEQMTLADIATSPSTIKWYNSINSRVELPTSTVLQPGQSYYASTIGANCMSSNRLMVSPTILDQAAPTTRSTSQFFCTSDLATLADLDVQGTDIKWYDALGNVLPNTTLVVDQTNYYASSTGTNCESFSKLIITTTISDLPTPSTSDTIQYFCSQNNATVNDISVNSSNVAWFLTPTGGLSLSPGTLLTDGTTYYGAIISQSCSSSIRLAVVVHIETVSSATTSNTVQMFCAPAQNAPVLTLADLVVTPSNVNWYTSSSGTSILPLTTPLQHNTTYYAAAKGIHCESANRVIVHAIINSPATPTTINSNQNFCSSTSPTIADIIVSNAQSVVWYDAATGGNALASTTPMTDQTTYYAFTQNQTCLSPTPLEVTVTIEIVTPPVFTNGTQVFCPQPTIYGPLTIRNLDHNNQNISWYLSNTATSPLAPSTPLINGHTYYAAAQGTSCESNQRTAQYVVLENIITPTAIDTFQLFCGATHPILADVIVSPSNVIWYDAEWGGNQVPLTTPLDNNTFYYAAGFNGNCESGNRLSVLVAFEIVPPVTTSNMIQYFCEPTLGQPALTLDDLSINQPTAIWYTAPTGGTSIPSSTALLNGQTYYAANGLGMCESSTRTPIMVVIDALGAPTVTNLVENFCSSETPTLANLQLANPSIIWYATPTGGSPLTSTLVLTNNTHYYGELNNGNCTSTSRVDVLVNIEIVNAPIFTNGVQIFCPPTPLSPNLTVADLETNGSTIVWYNSALNGNIIPANTPLTNNTTYYASTQGTSCNSSVRVPIVVQISNPQPPTTNQANQHFCSETVPTIDQISVNQSNVTWYSDAAYSTIVSPGTALINGQIYFGTLQDLNGCINTNPLTITTTFDLLESPTGIANVQFMCNVNGVNYTLQDLDVQNLDVVWYNNANQDVLLPPTTVISSNTTYYAFTTNGTCLNTNGAAIHVVFENINEPTTTNSNQVFCNSGDYTIANLSVNEHGVIWYDAPTNGNALPNTLPLTDQMTYYGALESQNCSSSTRLAITVSFENVATPTTGDNVQIFCNSTQNTLLDLSVNETNVQWYNSPTSTTPLATSTVLVNNTLYYAAITQGQCQSPSRLAVFVIVEDLVAPTSAQTTQNFCSLTIPTINQIVVNQNNIIWKDAAGNTLPGSTILVNGNTYYAYTQGIHCVSTSALAITVTVDNPNGGQLLLNNPTPCIGDTVMYTAPAGMINYNWIINGGQVVSANSDQSEVFILWNNPSANLDLTYTNGTNCIIHLPNAIQIVYGNCSDLSITKKANTTNAFIGDHVEFTITVTNIGSGSQTNVIISEIIRDGFNYLSHIESEGTYSPLTGEWVIPTMGPNSTSTLTIIAEVLEGGDHTNEAIIIHSDNPDSNSNNDSDLVEIEVECLTVYNEISPNGDGKNDVFIVDCINQYPNNSLSIFNRYGTLVYQVDDYKNDWSGTSNKGAVFNSKEDLPSGTYFYVLTINAEEKKEKSGWIYIIR